jgi:hypothetical protein
MNLHQRSTVNDSLNLAERGVTIGLVIAVLTSLLGISMFGVASQTGGGIAFLLGYVGSAFRLFSQYSLLPLWLSAWLLFAAGSAKENRIVLADLVPLLGLILYLISQIALAEPLARQTRTEMFLSTLIVSVAALPLCTTNGYRLIWVGMTVAGIIFFFALLLSGQLLSILRGEGIVGMAANTKGRVSLGRDTITSASIVFQCVLAGVIWLFHNHQKRVLASIILVACTSLSLVGLLTGSKGPLIGLALSLIVPITTTTVRMSHLLLFAMIFSVVVFVGLPLLDNYAAASDHIAIGSSDQKRLSYYEYVLSSTPTAFGNGVGSFAPKFKLSVAEGGYVHNAILEAYYETGIVGAALLMWVVISVGWKLIRISRNSSIGKFLLAYFVYAVSISMFSGSIFNDSELFFAFTLGGTIPYVDPGRGRQRYSKELLHSSTPS